MAAGSLCSGENGDVIDLTSQDSPSGYLMSNGDVPLLDLPNDIADPGSHLGGAEGEGEGGGAGGKGEGDTATESVSGSQQELF